MTEPVIGLYAFGEMELGRADGQEAAAKPHHTDEVDAQQEEK